MLIFGMARKEFSDLGRHRGQKWMPSASWSILNELQELHSRMVVIDKRHNTLSGDWGSLEEFVAAHTALLDSLYIELSPLLGAWDDALAAWGGEPTTYDWSRFRPLRLSREEDWSDWLAFLLERSTTGVFAARMLRGAGAASLGHQRPSVDREVSGDGYRADLVIHWLNGCCAHIEVKIGDAALGKTFRTGRKMRLRYRKAVEAWENFVLLLPSQVATWEGLESAEPDEPPVEALTWIDVCVALRSGLLSDESRSWKAWAYALVGAAEQALIGFPGHRLSSRPLAGLEAKVEILREGLKHG